MAFSFVIPGRDEVANPETISPSIRTAGWIPGLRLTAHPGMTKDRFLLHSRHWVHAMAVDKLGNVYTGEVDNAKRIQKFKLTSDALK
jgi:hypothetical protein